MQYKTIVQSMLSTMTINMIKFMDAYNVTINAGDREGANYYKNRINCTSDMLTEAGFTHKIKYRTLKTETNDCFKIFESVTFTNNENILNRLGIARDISNRPDSITHDFYA